MSEDQVVQESIAWVKAHKKQLIDEVCDVENFPPSPKPFTLFMAGSPGSGKTEFSKAYIKQIEIKDSLHKVLRLDVDELRERIPLYTGSNSDLVQKASTLLFDKVFDKIQANNQNVLVDGTFSGRKAIDDLERAINRNRDIGIIYLYQDPFIAWEYTLKREKIEGRTVPKAVFIKAYFTAQTNVNQAKKMFGEKVILDLFVKDESNNFENKAHFNIKNLNEFIKEKYTPELLERNLPDSL